MTVDHLEVLRAERSRLMDVLTSADTAARVPACPDWTVADLAWHLVAGQTFWHEAITRGLTDPREVIDRSRPDAHRLADEFAAASAALIETLAVRQPDNTCWSWHPDGGTIGWVRRRQAHELLIHRIDAEQAAGAASTPITPDVATDGVDELVGVFLTGTPSWATFTPDTATVRLVVEGTSGSWTARLGRCTGTPPGGERLELPALELIDGDEPATVEISGEADPMLRWLWRRADSIGYRGDDVTFERVVELLADVTR